MVGLAWRNFILQFQRYRVLAIALVLGAVVFTILFSVTSSLTGTVREKAARYFSGDIMVLGFGQPRDWLLHDEANIRQAFQRSGLDIRSYHRRSLYYETDAKLIFNGASLIQRRVIGLDLAVEKDNFSRLEFVEGGVPQGEVAADSLWVSNDTAQRLHLRVGDDVVLVVKTTQGFRNTISLKVAGIFQDSSFFGFASYLDYNTLNKVLGRPQGAITELGVTLAGEGQDSEGARRVRHELERLAPTAPWVGTLDAAYAWADAHATAETSYVVLPLSGRLKQINDLIFAILAVNLLLATIFLIVVAIGVYNTYQMIAFERTKEIGTMRALGMQKRDVVALFLLESLFLGLISSVVGLAVGALLMGLLVQWDFSGNLLVQMFLRNGRVEWAWPWQNMVMVLSVMWLTTLSGAIRPALKAAQQNPVDALRFD